MIEDIYPVEANDTNTIFKFNSIGIKGSIRKQVQYTLFGDENLYNLGFGDIISDKSEIDDLIITNNGDVKKIIATVAQTLTTFLDCYPHAIVLIAGGTPSRTRFYRISISNNFTKISTRYLVFGLKDDEWLTYTVNTGFDAFLIKKKLSLSL